MMKELQSVLAVRGVERERRKEERRQRRTRSQQTSISATLVQPTTQTQEDASETATGREDILTDIKALQHAEEGVERTSLSGSSVGTSENRTGDIVTDCHEKSTEAPAHETATVQPETLDIRVVERNLSVDDPVETSLIRGEGERDSKEPAGDRNHDWLALAPQLSTLAQAVMAARLVGVASGKKTYEEVFGDISDGEQ